MNLPASFMIPGMFSSKIPIGLCESLFQKNLVSGVVGTPINESACLVVGMCSSKHLPALWGRSIKMPAGVMGTPFYKIPVGVVATPLLSTW